MKNYALKKTNSNWGDYFKLRAHLSDKQKCRSASKAERITLQCSSPSKRNFFLYSLIEFLHHLLLSYPAIMTDFLLKLNEIDRDKQATYNIILFSSPLCNNLINYELNRSIIIEISEAKATRFLLSLTKKP